VNWTRWTALDAAWTERLSVAEKPGLLRTLAIVLAHSGDSWFWLLGLALVALVRPDDWRTWAVQTAAVIVAAAVLVLAVKFSVRRRRPEGNWGAIYRRTDPHSFPSGHAVRSMLLAVLCLGWGPAWLGWAALVWAPLVVLARVAMGVHFLSDVVAGAVFGIGLGILSLLLLPAPFA
jgi:undecaprenyl-diphosphatase